MMKCRKMRLLYLCRWITDNRGKNGKFSFSRVVSSSTEDCAARLSKKGPYIISSRVCTAYINVVYVSCYMLCSGRVERS